MAIIDVTASDEITITVLHQIESGTVQPHTFIPRGTAFHEGTAAIATLVAGNQTRFALTLSFPTNYTYLLKQLSVTYRADNATVTTFSDVAIMDYLLLALAQTQRSELFSNGASGVGSTLRSEKVWHPSVHAPRLFVDGNLAETVVLNFQDPDVAAGGQVAGDFIWVIEWYFFDQEQMLKWPVRTATPVLCY